MVNIQLADYGTIAQFGTRSDIDAKLEMMDQTLDDIVDFIDEFGVSLLGRCLCSRNFDFAKELLSKNAKVNFVTREGYNEFHLIAANLRCDGALDVAWMLLDRGVSLTAQDKRYKNTAVFALYRDMHALRTPESIAFMEACVQRIQKTDFDIKNKAGITLRHLINRSGPDSIKKIMEESA